MAFRYKLIHHPKASADYQEAVDYFKDVDSDLADLFIDDFKTALRGIETGRASSVLYATGHLIRWVKLRRFSHKIFFEPEGDDVRFVLAVISGRHHPARIRRMLGHRQKREDPSDH